MIGSFTEKSLHAARFAVAYFELRWKQSEDDYRRLRSDMAGFLAGMEVDYELPATKGEYDEQARALNAAVTRTLGHERSMLNGDTVALPLYLLSSTAFYAAMLIGLGEEGDSPDLRMLMQMVDAVLEDLGLDPALRESFHRDADWLAITREETDGVPAVRRNEVLRVGASFNIRVVEELDRREQEIEIRGALAHLTGEVRALRAEQRATAERLAGLITAGDAEISALLGEVKEALVSQGLTEQEAEQLTTSDPQTFAQRVFRWLKSDAARDAAEEAVWAALEFVPGGTAVKLGVKVSRAVRKSLKSSGG
jgi:hypothetical protein